MGRAKGSAAPPLERGTGRVHVWLVNQDEWAGELAVLSTLLTEDELGRSSRFRFTRDREAFMMRRALLRLVCGLYLDVRPERLQLVAGRYGKPGVAGKASEPALDFNASQSRDVALIALSRSGPVGVDLEAVSAPVDLGELGTEVLTPRERMLLSTLPSAEQREFFFRMWVCKEAYLKGLGTGFTIPPNQVEVFRDAHSRSRIKNMGGDHRPGTDWFSVDLPVALPFVGTVALQLREVEIELFRAIPPRRSGRRKTEER
jgi:4'-phosphopantetheinyl transferase